MELLIGQAHDEEFTAQDRRTARVDGNPPRLPSQQGLDLQLAREALRHVQQVIDMLERGTETATWHAHAGMAHTRHSDIGHSDTGHTHRQTPSAREPTDRPPHLRPRGRRAAQGERDRQQGNQHGKGTLRWHGGLDWQE
jgi:hypothetical protein